MCAWQIVLLLVIRQVTENLTAASLLSYIEETNSGLVNTQIFVCLHIFHSVWQLALIVGFK